mgnify:CR=1 FL=1
MSKSSERELILRVGDLENAMKVMGEMLSDETVPPKRRIDMAIGVLWRYDLAPKKAFTP